ncbi:MAG: sulfite exporter TauE/SafE family protein [Eubacteriales bacterium]|nr:sulfite exporter TauE/SafE family protein [Eubacteriales bacterium]
MPILYFLIAFGSTTVGALTGMGGGVIIKPVCDIIGPYDAQTIGVLACVTVFFMALVSLAKQMRQKTNFSAAISVPLSTGAVFGGAGGQRALERIAAGLPGSHVTVTQNIVLALLIAVVFWYMLYKDKLPTLHLQGALAAALSGVLLGFFSSFLGIGGGPINVALLIFLFSFHIKTATVCSILTILFSQISKIATIMLDGGFIRYDLSMLPLMIAGAVLGGFLGAKLNKQLAEKTVERAFGAVQLLVLALCIINVFRNL